jgi:hypothetical protein
VRLPRLAVQLQDAQTPESQNKSPENAVIFVDIKLPPDAGQIGQITIFQQPNRYLITPNMNRKGQVPFFQHGNAA